MAKEKTRMNAIRYAYSRSMLPSIHFVTQGAPLRGAVKVRKGPKHKNALKSVNGFACLLPEQRSVSKAVPLLLFIIF